MNGVDIRGYAAGGAVGILVVFLATGLGILSVRSPYGALFILLFLAVAPWTFPALGRLSGLVDLVARMRWWQFLWLLLFLSGLVLRIRTTSGAVENPLDPAAIYRVGLVAIVAVALLAMMAIRKIDLLAAMSGGLLLPLLLINLTNLMSTLWSVNPPWTLYKSIEFAVDSALIAVIVAYFRTLQEYKRLFDWTWFLEGMSLVSVGLGVLWAPNEAIVRNIGTLGFSVEGVIPSISRNGVGGLGALLTVVALTRIAVGAPNRRLFVWLLAIAVSALIISQTRSALLPVLIAIPFILVATRRFAWAVLIAATLVVLVLATGLGDTFEGYVLREGQFKEQNATLTGRTYYWSYAWDRLLERPFTGYGAYAGGRFVVAEHFSDTLSSSHGAFPEVAIGTSFWGVIPLLLLVLGVWVYLLREVLYYLWRGRERSLEWAMAVEATAVLIVISVRAFFSVGFVWHPSFPFLAIVGYAEFLRRRRSMPSVNSP